MILLDPPLPATSSINTPFEEKNLMLYHKGKYPRFFGSDSFILMAGFHESIEHRSSNWMPAAEYTRIICLHDPSTHLSRLGRSGLKESIVESQCDMALNISYCY